MFVRSGPALGPSPRSGPDGSPSRSAFGSAQTGSRNLPGIRAPQIRSRQAPDSLTGIRPRQDSRQSAGGSSPPDPIPTGSRRSDGDSAPAGFPTICRGFEPPRSGKTGARVWPRVRGQSRVLRALGGLRSFPGSLFLADLSGPRSGPAPTGFRCRAAPSSAAPLPLAAIRGFLRIPEAVRRLPVFCAEQPRAVPPPCRSQRFADLSGPRSGPAPTGFRCRAAPSSAAPLPLAAIRGSLRTPKRSGAYRLSVPSSPEQCRPPAARSDSRISPDTRSGPAPTGFLCRAAPSSAGQCGAVPDSPAQSCPLPRAAIRRLRAPPHPCRQGFRPPSCRTSRLRHGGMRPLRPHGRHRPQGAPRRRAGPRGR